MSASLAQSARVAAIIVLCKAGQIYLRVRTGHWESFSHFRLLLCSYFLPLDDLLFDVALALAPILFFVCASFADFEAGFAPLAFIFTDVSSYFARMPSRTHLAEAGMPSPNATDLNLVANSGYSILSN